MFASRTAVRATRAIRVNGPIRNARFSSTTSTTSTTPPSSGNHVLMGALGGAGAAIVIGTAFYQFSGVGKAVQTANTMKSYVDSATDKVMVQFKEQTPNPSEALNVLRDAANKYAAFIPGGKSYVDKVFNDLDIVKQKHGAEVDEIVNQAYSDLRDASKKGLTLDAAYEAYNVIQKHLSALGSLAVDASQDILKNHPELEEKLGGSFKQLQSLGDNLGPEVKKQVDETYAQVQDIMKQGVQWGSIDKIRKLVQQKVEEIKKLGNQAWDKGFEQVKPMLEKSPEVKKLVEENIDTLKQGNVGETLQKIKDAVTSKNGADLQKYIDSAKNKASQVASSTGSDSNSGLSSLFAAIPGGSQILPQLQKLKDVAEAKGPEAEKLAKETLDELMQVFSKRSEQAEKLLEQSKKEVK